VETVRDRVDREGIPDISRRAALAAGGGILAGAALPELALAQGRRRRRRRRGHRFVDLSHEYREDFPLFPGAQPTTRETVVTVEQDGFYGQRWSLWEHTCTHMDVPAHFVAGGRTSPELTVRELVAPLCVIDIEARAEREPDTVVERQDLIRFERRHGRIPRGAVVAMHSGWEERAGSEQAYRNTDSGGTMRFPGWSKEAVEWLLARRRIRGIGVDTMSLDHGSSSTFEAHLTLLGADRYGVENLRNLKSVPERGATIYLGLIPWREGSGGPCRAFART
jgi:kynurenine formamidase